MKYYKPDDFKVGGYKMLDYWIAEANGIVPRGKNYSYTNEAATDGKLYRGDIFAFQYNGKFYLDCHYVFSPLFTCYDNYSTASYIAEFDTKDEANEFFKDFTSGYKYVAA